MKKIIHISRHKIVPQQKKIQKQAMDGQKFNIIHLNPIKLDRKITAQIVDTYGTDAEYIIPGNIHAVSNFLWNGVKPLRFILDRKDATTCGAIPVYDVIGIERIKYLNMKWERLI